MFLGLLSVFVVNFHQVWTSHTEFLSFNSCHDIFQVSQKDSYRLLWNGKTGINGCRVSFRGFEHFNPLNRFKVCMVALNWTVPEPELTLSVYTGNAFSRGSLVTKYNNVNIPRERWCSKENQYVDVLLDLGANSSNNNTSGIELQITAELTYNHYDNGRLIGGTVGATVTLTIFGMAIILCIRQRACSKLKKFHQSILHNQNPQGRLSHRSNRTRSTGSQPNRQQETIEISYIVPRPPPYTSEPPPPYSSKDTNNRHKPPGVQPCSRSVV